MIRSDDVRSMLRLIADIAALDAPEQFGERVLPGIRELVPCHLATYNEVHGDTGTMTAAADPIDAMTPDAPEVFVRLAHQNPLFTRFQATRDGRPYKWSDFITRRELHRLDLYREAYAAMGAEYQMAFCLPSAPEVVIGFALNRERRDFSERDRTVLNLIRAPMISALAAVERYATLGRRLAAVERGLESGGAGVVTVDTRAGRPAPSFVSAGAREALGIGPGGTGGLPPEVERWLAALLSAGDGPAASTLLLEQPARDPLLLEFLPARRRGEEDALLVEPVAEPLPLERLRGAGLTERQAQVLRLVALGRSNAQIAAELGIAVATVGKHLEHVYERLGASSRTDALAATWSIARRGRADRG